MIIYIRMFLFMFVLILLTGCAPDKLDTSSEDATKASLEKITSSLSTEQKSIFQTAIQAAIVEAAFSGKSAGLNTALSQYNGKTGDEIIVEYQKVQVALTAERAAKQAKRKADLEKKIMELKAQQLNRMQVLSKLKLVKLEDAKIEKQEMGFMSEYRFIATVSNGSDITLTRVDFNFRITSPGREVPWNKDDGIFFIDGGLQPGEVRKESSSGDGMSGFILAGNAMNEHPEAILEWTVIDAYGVDEKSILPRDHSAEIEEIENEIKNLSSAP